MCPQRQGGPEVVPPQWAGRGENSNTVSVSLWNLDESACLSKSQGAEQLRSKGIHVRIV